MDSDVKLLEIEKKLERMHSALQRQEKELDSWRDRSVRVPNWIRNAGFALFLTLIGQTMAAVWWAAQIEGTQVNIVDDVRINTEYRIQSTERYNEIMIQLTKMEVMMTNHFEQDNLRN